MTIGTFTHFHRGYKTFFTGALFLILLAGVPSTLMAFSMRHGNSVYIGKSETIEGNLYVAASSITIEGRVTGDLICAGETITVNGTVEGDVIGIGRSIVTTGPVHGSVRVMGASIQIGEQVSRSLMVFSGNVNMNGNVGWDALVLAGDAKISGNVGRSLLGGGGLFLLNGAIGQDVLLHMGDEDTNDRSGLLTVGDSARIGGRLEYVGANDAVISPNARIQGKVIHTPPSHSGQSGSPVAGAIGWLLVSTLSALIVALVLVKVAGPIVEELSNDMIAGFWPHFGWGALWTIVTPLLALFVAMTVLGFRLALLSMGVWGILMALGKIIAGIALGRLLVARFWSAKKDSLMVAATIGLVLLWPISYIPVFGWLLSLVVLFWGVGGVCLFIKKKYDGMKAAG